VAAVELAIFLPFLMFLFLVTVDFCRIFYVTQVIENSARNGALFASRVYNDSTWSGSVDTIEKAVRAETSNLDQSKLSVTSSTTATDVTVTVTYNFSTLVSFPGIPNSVTIVRPATMQVAPAS
jgi:Flp pilus assembly protein TadG